MYQTVLITGAGGSIGSELLRQVIKKKVTKNIIINDLSEYALFQCIQDVNSFEEYVEGDIIITPVLGDISHSSVRQVVSEAFGQIDMIYHAAAYKHVGLSMKNPAIYYKNNINSTKGVLELAKNFKAAVVHISTDKAIYPTNHMGFSKRLCEFLYFTNEYKNTNYKIVRFGNVLNSNGSVVPIFKQQIAHGGPVTVTDPHTTRYFMSISEAVALVLSCYRTNDEFSLNILDMGAPQLIDQLARNLIEQAGHKVAIDNPSVNEIMIKYIGLREGEKLHEQLSYVPMMKTNVENIATANEISHVDNKFLEKVIRKINSKHYEILDSINWIEGKFKE